MDTIVKGADLVVRKGFSTKKNQDYYCIGIKLNDNFLLLNFITKKQYDDIVNSIK